MLKPIDRITVKVIRLLRLVAISRAPNREDRREVASTEGGVAGEFDIPWVDPSAEYIVLFEKGDGGWAATVSADGSSRRVPPGRLEAVIIAAEQMIPELPIRLSPPHAEHRGRLVWGNITLKVAERTSLDAAEVLKLIDAKSGGDGLDLSGCLLQELDLSRPFIERKWASDPDVSHRWPPAWRSDDSGGVDLRGACLKEVSFFGSQLQGADLRGTNLRGAHLSDTDLSEAHMNNADLRDAFLTGTQLQRADLMSANLQQAHLFQAQLQTAQLFGTDWRGATVLRCKFEGASLGGAHLEGTDFYYLEPGALSGVQWSGAFLDRTRIRLEQLGGSVTEEIEARTGKRTFWRPRFDSPEVITLSSEVREDRYRQAREVYLLLKNNFSSIGRYSDASWAYSKERTMERGRLFRAWNARNPGTWRNLGSWMINWVDCALTGYGERPWRTAWAAAGAILVFAAGYDQLNNINPTSARSSSVVGDLCFWDALIYSGATFFTLGLAAMEPVGRWAQIMSVAESGIGISLVALLIFSLGNRISRS